MKKTLLSLFFFAGFQLTQAQDISSPVQFNNLSFSATADSLAGDSTAFVPVEIIIPEIPAVVIRKSVEEESRDLQKNLLLNEAQYLEIKEINKVRRQMIDAITSMYPHEPAKREDRIKELEKQYDLEFGKVLNKQQLNNYLALNGRGADAPEKPKAPEGPTFNSQVHTMIQRAVTPVYSSQVKTQNVALLPTLAGSLNASAKYRKPLKRLVPVTIEKESSDINSESQASALTENGTFNANKASDTNKLNLAVSEE